MSKDEHENGGMVNLTVINVGRRPVNLIRAGFQYQDGMTFQFPSSWQIQPNWLYNMQTQMFHLPLKQLKEFINKHEAPVRVKFIYFTSESGDPYKIKIPSGIIQALHS